MLEKHRTTVPAVSLHCGSVSSNLKIVGVCQGSMCTGITCVKFCYLEIRIALINLN